MCLPLFILAVITPLPGRRFPIVSQRMPPADLVSMMSTFECWIETEESR